MQGTGSGYSGAQQVRQNADGVIRWVKLELLDQFSRDRPADGVYPKQTPQQGKFSFSFS